MDTLLRDYLSVGSEADADRHLEHLFSDVAAPIVRRTVQSAMRDDAATADADDVVANTLADLLRRLREARAGAAEPIDDFRGYAAACAYNRYRERLREQYPARARLRSQLQYLFAHHPRLTAWRDTRGAIVCGLRGPEALDDGANDLAALTIATLRDAGMPLELDALVTAIGQRIGVDREDVPLDDVEVVAPSSPEADLVARRALAQLWRDVRRLSLPQRLALLLHLPDAYLLPLTGTATISDIAEALEIPPRDFAELWDELPLSDAAIAVLLNATPRQVIKLRHVARERLRRGTSPSFSHR